MIVKRGLLILGWLLITSVVAGAEVEGAVTLEQLLREGDQNNPGLIRIAEQVVAAQTKIDQVASMPDPTLSLALSSYPIESLTADESPMTGNEIRLAQTYPFFGKLSARRSVASQQAFGFDAAYQDARLQLRQKIKDAWVRLLFQRQALILTQRNLELIDDFITLTETRYAVGSGLQQNVLKAHLQRSKQLDQLLLLQQQEEATRAELNSLVGHATDRPLLTNTELSPASDRFELDALQEGAERRPLEQVYRAQREQAQAQRDLARLDYRPDFTLWGSYRWRDDGLSDGGGDFVSAGVSFSLPVRRERRHAAVAEADSAVRLSHQRRNEWRNQVDLDIHRALTAFEQAGRLAELYQTGILPQANQTFQATLSAYRVDQVDFLDLLDALMTLYRYQIDHIRAVSEQRRSLAKLEAAAALDIDLLPNQTAVSGER